MTAPDWGPARAECIRRADELVEEVRQLAYGTFMGAGTVAQFPEGHHRAALRCELAAGYYESAGLGLAARECLTKAKERWASIDQPDRIKACEAWLTLIDPIWGGLIDA